MVSPVSEPSRRTLHRFWAVDPSTPEPQEWEGWWDGRHWVALYGDGMWSPEFVVRWEEGLDPDAMQDALVRAGRGQWEREMRCDKCGQVQGLFHKRCDGEWVPYRRLVTILTEADQ